MGNCIFCQHCDTESANADKEMDCKLLGIKVTAMGGCAAYKKMEISEEDKAHIDDLLKNANTSAKTSNSQAKTKRVTKTAATVKEREEEFSIKLYDHQKLAREKFRLKNEIALFFEMGCGKSLTSLMIIADKFKANEIDSLLIVAPNDVHKQWFDDLCNDESVLAKALVQEGIECSGQIIGGRGGQKQFYEFDNDNKLHIVVTNIDTFSTPHKWEVLVAWANEHKTAIILDEATVIKNPTSKRGERMLYEFNDIIKKRRTVIYNTKKPNTQVRIVLTGTPVSNGPMDLWSIMEFIKPNYFGRNYYSFMNYYGMHTKLNVNDRVINVLLTENTWRGIKNCDTYTEAFSVFGCSEDTYLTIKHQDKYLGPYKHADELRTLLEPSAVFAKLVDCVDMPKCNYIIRRPALSAAQTTAYESMKRNMLAKFGDYITMAKNTLTVSMRLQQISSGFIVGKKDADSDESDSLFWADETEENYDLAPDEVVWLDDVNPKLEMLLRDVDELDKPLLIITRFSAEAAKIYDLLKDKYNCCLFTGWKVVGSIDKFKSGEHDIIIANIAKISRGHNLQCAHTTLYYSNTFSMEHRQQSEFRTFRIGQTYPCTYIDYVSCPVDQTVLDSLTLKKGLLEYIRDKDTSQLF